MGVAAWATDGNRVNLGACHDVGEEVEEGGVEVEKEREWERATSGHLERGKGCESWWPSLLSNADRTAPQE